MKIVFTLCSNNYLSAAKVLVDSFKVYHRDFEIVIGLVDKMDERIDYSAFDCSILPLDDIDIPGLQDLSEKFNIVELNTTAKPFYFRHFFFNKDATQVIYLDPDIQVFSPLEEVIKGLDSSMITLTPHMLSPVDDEYMPNDYDILRTGIFNLGFVAISRHPQLSFFLDWWSDRCVKYGFRKDDKGMFYDQVWMNFVPTFFDSYYIIRHPGYNVANWNLHERKLSCVNDTWMVNNSYSLAFFHYSHYNIDKPENLSSYNSRFNLQNRPDVAPIFNAYRNTLIANQIFDYKKFQPFYKHIYERAELERLKQYYTFKRKVINKVTGLLNRVLPD